MWAGTWLACFALLCQCSLASVRLDVVEEDEQRSCVIVEFGNFSLSVWQEDQTEEGSPVEIASVLDQEEVLRSWGSCPDGQVERAIGFSFRSLGNASESQIFNVTLIFTSTAESTPKSWWLSEAVVLLDGVHVVFAEAYNDSTSVLVASSGYGYECDWVTLASNGSAGTYQLDFASMRAQAFNVEDSNISANPDVEELDSCASEPERETLLSHTTAAIIAGVFGGLIGVAMGAYLVHCFVHGNGSNNQRSYQRLENTVV